MTGKDIERARECVKELRQIIYGVIADGFQDASHGESGAMPKVFTAKAFDSLAQIVQSIELIDGYLFVLSKRPQYMVDRHDK